jgi:DNA-binding NarL/FixJ family response regulator
MTAGTWTPPTRFRPSQTKVQLPSRKKPATNDWQGVPPITVVIADRDRERRAECVRLLSLEKGIRILGQARSGLETLACAGLNPRILLLDLSFSALLSALLLKSPGTKVILVAGRASETRILEALCNGAQGYVESRVLRTLLPKALRTVDAGQAWVPRGLVPNIVDRLTRLSAA